MKRLIPRRREWVLLVVMALMCTALASSAVKTDLALSVTAMPLFLVSCLLGMKRNGQLSRRD